ncbi:LOW QUALITY PROTEIN: GSK-3-binding protein FRAT2-like [Suncus etruscus]|uniref:LOW QUALITY PROTEIN: GSK-3-binding protein FRAT2-like n=1 Tax=Suncus etruscus TaxID=109475 RepID=UPI002110857C|nr:LOW QUALITY PROTEIN: GSK-3-binding protein FRAT2-like [Suncus etruscus]
MPCRREAEEDAGDEAEAEEEEEEDGDGDSFLLLQQSVTLGGSGDVDRLVARIGETLQLDAAAHDRPEPPRAPPADKARPPALPWPPPPPALAPAPAQPRDPAAFGAWRCALGERGRVRGRAAPYFVAEQLPASGPGALPGPCRRGWLRDAVSSRRLQPRRWPPAGPHAGEDDPHRLLQQLVLSGNLIKEAVRRLQRAVAAVAAPGNGRAGPDPVALQPSGAWH